jgi:hydroxyacylglutathione hydrolase
MGNIKFGITVAQDGPMKRLQELAETSKETQGKATIGDEKVWKPWKRIHPSIPLTKVGRNTMSSCESR